MTMKKLGLIVIMIQSICLGQKATLKKQAAGPSQITMPRTAIIKGIWEREVKKGSSTTLILYKVNNGQKAECARVLGIDEQHKQFSFAVSEKEEGLYYIADGTGWWYIRIYLKPGDVQDLVILDDSGEYKLSQGTQENNVLYKWDRLMWPMVKPVYDKVRDNSSYSSYFKTCDSVKQQVTGFAGKNSTTNVRFNALLHLIVATEPDFFAVNFFLTPRLAHKENDTSKPFAFYRPMILKESFCDAKLLELGDGINILSEHILMRQILHERSGIDVICNDTLKGAQLISGLWRIKYYEQMKALDSLKKYLVTSEQQQAFNNKWKSMDTFLMPGRPAYNFEMRDTNDKTVSLQDLKGNVVVVDAWATWCGPCKEQIPYLKKMEDEFEGRKVKFVSISLDEEKSKEAWANMVKDKQMGGIQLFGKGFSGDFAKFYAIQAIPRFLVFDKNGKIITCDAPRPSDPALKQMLLKAL
jgi:thiol-disulfide isomerase/thioredoxin